VRSDSTLQAVRTAIYEAIVERGVAPSAAQVGASCGISKAEAEEAFTALADAHVIILQPSSFDLWAAPPFAAVPTGFRVEARGRSWSAPCAWDSFGVAAALHADANISASCGWSGEPVECGVRGGRVFGGAVIHLLVPAAHFWDDIVYT